MNNRIIQLATQLFLVITLSAAALNAGAADPAFEQGKRAFNSGDYESALKHFDQAWINGIGTATLTYNRAVTLYKLGRLEAAKHEFSSLLLNVKWVHLARYNLGWIAEEQGRMEEAYARYVKVSKFADNESLKRLANEKLEQLQVYAPAKETEEIANSGKNAVLLSLGFAADDNATGLADELVSRATEASDTYFNALAYGHHYVSGERYNGVKFYGLAQLRRYKVFNSFDSTVAGAGTSVEFPLWGWNFDIGGRLLHIGVDTGTLANQYSVLTKAAKRFGSGRLEGQYQSSFFAADEEYLYLEGWQHQLKIGWQHKFGQVVLSPELTWQMNDRENKETEENFISYSPTRTGLALKARWEFSQRWRFYSKLGWLNASYSDENRLTDIGGEELIAQRDTTYTEFMLGARYRLAPRWFVKGEYDMINSDDNYQLYSYSKNVAALKLEYAWE